MKLDIYGKKNGKKQIVKTYEVREYDLMFGTIEELAREIKLDDLKEITDSQIIKMVGGLMMNSLSVITDLLQDMFDGITEEEIRNAKVKDIAKVLVDVVIYTALQLDKSFAWGASKNVQTVRDET